MGNASIFNVGGANYGIADATARTNAQSALSEAEWLRQESIGKYGGRSLASAYASEIAAKPNAWRWLRDRVRSANFAGLHIKDYLTLTLTNGNNVTYRIGAIDPYYQCGDAAKGHHVVMVPSAPPAVTGEFAVNGSYVMWNATNNNNGNADQPHPYLACNLHAYEVGPYYSMLPQDVRDNIMNQRVLLETRYSASGTLTDSTGWAWADLGPVWSPSETEVYGTSVWGDQGYGTGFDCQFPIFKQTADRINGTRCGWWLRSAARSSSADACYVNNDGYANYYGASNTWVRALPCFLIG